MHTGSPSTVTIEPASADTGIRFRIGDQVIPASADLVVSTRRCTTLGAYNKQVGTVEHLLSALSGCGIDNAEIEVEGEEIPILDGSAREWVSAIEASGIAELGKPVVMHILTKPVALQVEDSWMVASPSDEFKITCVSRFDHPMLGTEVVTYRHNPRHYAEQVAPARTFGFIEEVEALRAAGLARGGSIENALIVFPDRFSSALRLPHECNRHKLLDLIGDLSLTGRRFRASITAVKPSHKANVEFARTLASGLVIETT
jgi:UDP-3-O-[3-hydroxymyristoyl] N-acetylglucosamine deacetylase